MDRRKLPQPASIGNPRDDELTFGEREPTLVFCCLLNLLEEIAMRCLAFGSLFVLCCCTGCDVNVTVDGGADSSPDPSTNANAGSSDSDGFSLEIPGLGVDVKGKDGSWDVTAPGTDVRVQDGKVGVRAPGTEVDADLNTGETRVRAPGTSVDVR